MAKATIQHALTVKQRAEQGTRPVHRLRSQGLVPGIVYGREMKPLAISVNQRELTRLLHSKRGEHALVTLRLADGTSWEKPALVHAVQHDPVDGHVVHVDFHAILLTQQVRVKVPIRLTGESADVKQAGGILEHFLREIEVECLPTDIPAGVEFDVSAMKIGDTVHVSDLTPPTGAKILSDPDGVLASIQQPKEEKPEEEAAAVAEPEVLREKKPEGVPGGDAEPAKGGKTARPGAAEGRAGEKSAESKKEK
jgi:large subunit ribosomal protein L25